MDFLIKCGIVTSKLLLLLLQYSSNSSNTRSPSTISPWWIFNIESETLFWCTDGVDCANCIDTPVLPSNVVYVEVGACGTQPLARSGLNLDFPASLLSPGKFCYGRICFCIYSENIGAVNFEIDFFYCINELRLIWK